MAAVRKKGRERVVRPFDFRRPNKLSREHVRALSIVQEAFTRGVGTQLASVLRAVSQMRTVSIEQKTWDEYLAQTASPCYVAVLSLSPLPGATLLCLPLEAAYTIVELQMGGSGLVGQQHPERALSEIENGVLRGFVERLMPELRNAFVSLSNITPRILAVESSAQFAQVAGPNDPVVVVQYSLTIDAVSTSASLCIPYSSLQGVLDENTNAVSLTSVQYDAAATRRNILAQVQGVPVSVSARFAPCPMLATDVLNLKVGDVVRLGSSTDAALTLYAEEQPTHLVKVGKSGRKIAVEVIESVLVAKNWNYSTDGGR